MKISTMAFLTKQGLRNLGTHWLMTVACVGSLCVCLVLNGFAQLIKANVDNLVGYMGQQNETVVYLDPNIDDAGAQRVGDELAAIEGVGGVYYMSKHDVLSTYRNYMEEYSSLWDEFEDDNPFKANYKVTVVDIGRLPELSAKMEKIEGVVKVSAPVELAGIFVTIKDGTTRIFRIFTAVLLAVSIITVYSTIRLSVYARRREVEIMKYVGATDHFVAWPFLIEGLAMGLISSLISAGTVFGIYQMALEGAQTLDGFWNTIVVSSLVPMSAVYEPLMISFIISGCGIGGIGSLISIRKHLRV